MALDGEAALFCADSRTTLYRLELATRKITELRTKAPPKHLASIGQGRVAAAAFDFEKQEDFAVVLDANTGETLVELRFPEKRESVTAVVASATHVAVSTGHMNAPSSSIELFTQDGAHVRSVALGRQGVTNTVDALIFSEDGAVLRYLLRGQLLSHVVATGAETRVACDVPPQHNSDPRTSRQGALLLLQFHSPGHWTDAWLVREADGAVVTRIAPSELVTFGRPGELVWQKGVELRLLALDGTKTAESVRKKKTRLEAGLATPEGLWIAGGPSSVELVDLPRFDEPE
jgi:hypothetical protein